MAPLTAADRLRRLLGAGYFPSELPPPFTTFVFALRAKAIMAQIDSSAAVKVWTTPESFSIPRWGQARRKLSIVNPISQLLISNLIAENWDEIGPRLAQSKISEFHPEIVARGGRAVTGVDFDGVQRRRAQILARYGRYVKADVARFYASVYTHSIPWAILGKEWVKANFTKPEFEKHYSNQLDKALRAGNNGQTVGIPIGPDTSRIISELVACGFENNIKNFLPDIDDRSVRYVDDMIIGLKDSETTDTVLAAISSSLSEYELDLNIEKTSVHGLGVKHAPEWMHFLKRFQISGRIDGQRDDIDSFFEQTFYLADENYRENVIRYAVRRATSFSVDDHNWYHFIRCLLYVARRGPSSLATIVEYSLSAQEKGRQLPLDEIRTFIEQNIVLNAEASKTFEVSWLLFWAKELKISLPASLFPPVTRLRSGVLALLTFDLRNRGLIMGDIDEGQWLKDATNTGLRSEMWLATYEATRKHWWRKSVSDSFIKTDKYFSAINSLDISFYDLNKKAKPGFGQEFLQHFMNRSGGSPIRSPKEPTERTGTPGEYVQFGYE